MTETSDQYANMHKELDEKLIKFQNSLDINTQLLKSLSNNVNIEAKIRQLESNSDSLINKALLYVAIGSGVFTALMSLNILWHTYLIAFGKIVLKSEEFGWLLAHDTLLAVTGVSLLGIVFTIAKRSNRD